MRPPSDESSSTESSDENCAQNTAGPDAHDLSDVDLDLMDDEQDPIGAAKAALSPVSSNTVQNTERTTVDQGDGVALTLDDFAVPSMKFGVPAAASPDRHAPPPDAPSPLCSAVFSPKENDEVKTPTHIPLAKGESNLNVVRMPSHVICCDHPNEPSKKPTGGGGSSKIIIRRRQDPPAPPAAATHSAATPSSVQSAQGHSADMNPKAATFNTMLQRIDDERAEERAKTEAQPSPTASPKFFDAADDWEEANKTRLDALRRENEGPSTLLSCDFEEALRELRADEANWKQYLKDIKREKEAEDEGFFSSCFGCFTKTETIGVDSPLYTERDFLLCLAKMPLDISIEIHRRMILTVHRNLTRPKGDDPDPLIPGDDWERIGFQGQHPKTDLRAAGMFGLLQLLFLTDYRPDFSQAVYTLAHNKRYEFPLALVSLAISCYVIDGLQEKLLNNSIVAQWKEDEEILSKNTVKRKDNTSSAVSTIVCRFHVGCLHRFFVDWGAADKRSILDFDKEKKAMWTYAKGNVPNILERFNVAKEEFSRTKNVELARERLRQQISKEANGGEQLQFSDF